MIRSFIILNTLVQNYALSVQSGLVQPQLKNKEYSDLQNFIKNFIYWNDDKRPPNPFSLNKRNKLSRFIEILSKWSKKFDKSLFFDLVQELLTLINEADHPEEED